MKKGEKLVELRLKVVSAATVKGATAAQLGTRSPLAKPKAAFAINASVRAKASPVFAPPHQKHPTL